MRALANQVPILAALWVVALGAAAPAGADPIHLASGSIHYSRGNLPQFSALTADGASIRSDFGDFAGEIWNPDHACFGCAPGSTIGLTQSESFDGSDAFISAGGSVRVGDTDFWIQSLDFQIASGSFTLPDSSGGVEHLRSPFVFRGVIVGLSLAGETRTFDLSGTGTGTSTFAGNDWFATTYAFASPTPEPGTLLLLAGPAAVALIRRRRASSGPSTGD